MSQENVDQIDPNFGVSLSSLALLSLTINDGKDYLDYLTGFVIEALQKLEDESIDATRVKEVIQNDFGLTIPEATFTICLKRLTKQGILKLIAGGLQYAVVELPKTNLAAEREKAASQISEVASGLTIYAQTKYSVEWTDEKSFGALIEFLDRYTIEFLRFTEGKSPLPEVEIESDESSAKYVVASYIKDISTRQPTLFNSVKILVKSRILSNALMCPDLKHTNRGFKGVTLFVDTAFLIKAMGLESEIECKNARNLLEAIIDLKGVLCIFPETKEETRTVLRAIAKGLQAGRGRGNVTRELLKRGRGAADVILAETDLESKLRSLNISTLAAPSYSESQYKFQIDEEELREEIEGEVDYFNENALDHDVRVVRHVYALRKGHRASSIEDCRYVFLTTNSGLSRAAFRYARQSSSGWIFSSVVTDFHLSHLVWLKLPVAVSDQTEVEILASCYAAMKPSEAVWNRYLEEVDRLKAENKTTDIQHEALRFSVGASEELMEVTRGDVDGINSGNLHLILENLEKNYAKEKEAKLSRVEAELEESQRVAKSHAKRLKEVDKGAEALKSEKRKHEKEVAALKAEVEKNRERDGHRRGRIGLIARLLANAFFVLLALICLTVGLMSLLAKQTLYWAIPFLILGLVSALFGFNVYQLKEKLEFKLNQSLQNWMD